MKWISGLIAIFLLIVVVLHSSAAKSFLRSAFTHWATSELGAEVELQELDYRLWRGELILRGLRFAPTTEEPAFTLDAREVALSWSPTQGASVSVKSPHLKLLQTAGTQQAISIPAGLAALTIEDGALLVSEPGREPRLEITAIEAELIARQGTYEGSVHSSSGRVEGLVFSNLQARFEIHGSEIEIVEALVEEGPSRIQARGSIPSLSPLEAELDLDFHLDAQNVQALAPELEITGEVEGKASAVMNSAGLHVSAEIRSPALKSPLFGQWAVDGEITLENNLLDVHRVALQGYGGEVEAKGRLDWVRPSHSMELTFAGVEIPALSRIWAKRPLPIASRADGFMKLDLTDWSLNGAGGSGRISFSPLPTEVGVPLTGAIDLSAVSGEIRFDTQQLAMPGVSLEIDGGLHGDGSLTADFAAGFEEVHRLGPILQFFEISAPPPELGGAASLQGHLSGNLFQLSSLSSHMTLSSDSLLFHKMRFGVEANIRLAEQSLDLVGSVENLDLSGLTGSFGGIVNGRFEATGDLLDPDLSASLEISHLEMGEISGKASLLIRKQERRLLIDNLEVQLGSASASITGHIGLDSGEVAARLDARRLHLKELDQVALGVDGIIPSMEAEIEGVFPALQGRASFSVEDAAFRGADFPPLVVDARSNGAVARMNVRLPNGLALAETELELDEPFPFRASLDLSALPLDGLIEALFPSTPDDTRLAAHGRLEVHFPLLQPGEFRYKANIEQMAGFYRGVGGGTDSPFVIEGDRAAITIADLNLVGTDTAIEIEGTYPLTPEGDLDLILRGKARLELASPFLDGMELAGEAGIEVYLGGSASSPDPMGEVTIKNGSGVWRGLRVEGLETTLEARGGAIRLKGLEAALLGGRVQITGTCPLPRPTSSDPARLDFTLTGLDLAELVSPSPLRLRLSASAKGSIEARGLDLSVLSGSGDLHELQAGLGELEFEIQEAVPWNLTNRRFTLSRLHWMGGQTDLELSLAATFGEVEPSWSASLQGRWDNALLNPFLSSTGNLLLAGTTQVDLEVKSSAEGPLFSGLGSLERARLSVREPSLVLSNLAGQARFQGQSIELTELAADVGGGKLTGSGTVELTAEPGLQRLDLHMEADSVRLDYPVGMRSNMSGSIQLSGEPGDFLLAGDIRLLQALFHRNLSLETELLGSIERQVAPWTGEESFAETVRLNLRARTVDELRIDNNLAKVQATADLRATGTVAFPEVDGILTAQPEGTFQLGRNTYRIESGSISFAGYPTEPAELDLVARTSVSGFDIVVELRGTGDALAMELRAPNNPELTQADKASLLVTGRTILDLQSVSGPQARLLGEQLATYLSGTLAGLVQQGLGQAFPFDQISVVAAQIGNEVDPEIRFTLGKAVTDELFLTYSIGLNDAQKQLWVVDYQLPLRFGFRATRQEDNKFNTSLSHELHLDLPGRPERAEPGKQRERIASVHLSFEGAPPEIEDTLKDKVGMDPGDPYDYWKSQDDVDRLTRTLRREGYLGAVVEAESKPAGDNEVDLFYKIDQGPPIRIQWEGDDPGKSIRKKIETEWTGRLPENTLLPELAASARRELQRQGYFQARVSASASQTAEGAREVQFVVHKDARGEAVALAFEGNQALTDRELRNALPPSSSADFFELVFQNTVDIRQTLHVLYASHGYLQARVDEPRLDYQGASRLYRIVISVEEGPLTRTSQIGFEGAESMNQAALRRHLKLAEGFPFLLSDYAQDRSTLASIYRREGFVDARVRGRLEPTQSGDDVDVWFEIEEGPLARVGSIRIIGNHVTREDAIRRQLTFQEGAPLRVSTITETQRRLYDLGVFRSVDIRMEPATEGSAETEVVIEVDEAADVDISYGLRFSTEDRFAIQASLQFPNLMGSAQNAGLNIVANKNRTLFRPTYYTPYIWKYRIDSNVFLSRETEEDEFFSNRAWELTFQQTKKLRQLYDLQWSYTFRQSHTLGKVDTGPFPFEFTARQSILTASLVDDRRDNLIQPTGGRFWNITFQFAPEALGSDIKFTKLFGQLFTFVPLGHQVVWASSYRIGIADAFDQNLLLNDRFRAGGANTVRGFAENSLGPADPITDSVIGGEGILVLNQEIRFPIYRWFQGIGFYDAGNVYLKASDFNPLDLRHSAGIGLRVVFPFGLLRFDWARVLDRQPGEKASRFWFSLNHAF